MIEKENNDLWVIFKPVRSVIPPASTVLSFLSPVEEKFLKKEHRNISGNEASMSVRRKSGALYPEIVADVSVTRVSDKLTLRQAMKEDNETSPWWYHAVAFRDPERDQVFNNIIKVLTIQKTAEEYGSKRIVLCGAESCLATALRSAYDVQEIEPVSGKSPVVIFLSGFISRFKYLLNFLRYRNALKKNYQLPSGRNYDLVFSGFWDWSFWENKGTGKLDDRYFKNLLHALKSQGVNDVSYFAWFDPDAEPDKKWRLLSPVLQPLNGRDDVVILQMFLKISDVMEALLNFRPLKVYKKAKRKNKFQTIFQKNGLNLFPLFEMTLLAGYVDSHIPYCELVAKAVERAARKYSPLVSLSFLEHFPYSRAYYEGMRRSEKKTSCWAMQHAAYNHEKTFYYLDPDIEFRGLPDGNAVPRPDRIFVMGRLGQKLFLECGYGKNQISLTGSTRYDYIKMPMPYIIHKSPSIEKVILLVCTLSADTELPMIEAVSLAAQNIEGLRLRIRNHPFMRVDKQPRYKRLNLNIETSKVSLEEDLANCDLIMFSYSTIAEEAFLRGIPVWQWLPQGFNGSALAEVMDIPRFWSVSSLQTALSDFYKNPDLYRPTKEMIQKVAEQIFYPADGGATARIAEECLNYLKEKKQKELI